MLNYKLRVASSGIPGWIHELQKGAKIDSVPAELITERNVFSCLILLDIMQTSLKKNFPINISCCVPFKGLAYHAMEVSQPDSRL